MFHNFLDDRLSWRYISLDWNIGIFLCFHSTIKESSSGGNIKRV